MRCDYAGLSLPDSQDKEKLRLYALDFIERKSKGLNVLKISVMETQTESRWILQAQLLGPWVNELRRH